MERSALILGVVIAACTALIFAVMLWPAARPPTRVDPDDEPSVRITPATRISLEQPTLKALRQKLQNPDGGPTTVDPQTAVVAKFAWGSGKNQLGRHRPREGNPEAPMSVGVDRAGNALVLDQVNGRLLKIENGAQAAATPLTVQNAQDFALARNGNTAVMDRLTDKAVALLGPDGKAITEYKLSPKTVGDPAKLTGVFVDGDGVYVEREHADLVRLGDTKGTADAQHPEIPGRPTRDGRSYVSANITDGARGKVAVTEVDRSTREHRFTREVGFGMPVLQLLLLDTDQTGLIYLAAAGERLPEGQYSGDRVAVVDLLCLDPIDGRPLGRAELPPNTSADETFREMAVLDQGGVIYLYRTEQGAELRRVDCR